MMEKKNHAQLTLIGLTMVVLYVCYLILRPFITPVLFGCVIGIVFYPIHTHVKRIVRSSSGGAVISTLLILLLTSIPFAFLVVAISNELAGIYQALAAKTGGPQSLLADILGNVDRIVAWVGKVFGVPPVDVRALLTARLESASATLLHLGTSAVTNLFSFMAQAAIALVVLFFSLRDGEHGVSAVLAALPLDEKRASELRSLISSTVITNVYGGVVVGALQGTLAGLSFWAVGINSPVLWGVVTGVFSLVPILGSAIVWVPASLALLITGHFVKALILLALGAGLIGTIDNIVRPLIICKSLQLHPILVFLSLLGGVQLFGVLGLFVGPVVLSVAAALVVMLREDLTTPQAMKSAVETPAIHVAATHAK